MDDDQQPRPHQWGLGAFLLVEAIYLLSSLALALVLGGKGSGSISAVVVGVALPTFLAAWFAVVITNVRGNGPRLDLKLNWSWRNVAVGLLFGFGGLLVTFPASLLWLSIVGEDANSAAGEAFGGLRSTWAWAVAVFFLVAIVAPIFEEILYRGLLWGALDWRWGRWVALLVTTVVFAVAHLEWTRTPLLLVVALPIGLARLYADSLVASIVAHQVTNLLPGLVLMFSVAGALPAL